MNGIVAGMTVSGIMVDGISEDGEVVIYGKNECKNGCDGVDVQCKECAGSSGMGQQDFLDADMIVVRAEKFASSPERLDKTRFMHDHIFKAFAIYGNKVVETEIRGARIRGISNQVKVVWANKKPYILNGDHASHINYGG